MDTGTSWTIPEAPEGSSSTASAPPSNTSAGSRSSWIGPGALSQWLVDQRNAGVTPDAIAARLVANGWAADAAATTSLRSLRSADRQTLTYATLNLSAGIAALGLATSAHLLIDGNPNPITLTTMLTIALVAGPIAGVAAHFANRAEGRSNFVLWSPSRRGWFGTLAACTAVVGIVRLIAYIFRAIATLTGASDADFTVASAGQVLVSLAVSIPLFIWSFAQWRRSNLVMSALSADESQQ